MLTAGSHRPWVGFGPAEYTARQVELGDNLLALSVLGTHNVDGSQKRRNHRKHARVSNVSARANAPAEAEANRTRVADGRVQQTIRGEVSGGFEGFGVGVIVRVMQNTPVRPVSSVIYEYEKLCMYQTALRTMVPFGMW
jgi:hypothetical protein